MAVSLYIDGKLADTNNIPIPMIWETEDFKNPTAVKNSYSQKITLVGTSANNAIFSLIYKLNMNILLSGGTPSFNPSKKTPFELRTGDLIQESGYLQLTGIKTTDGQPSYEIQLYGGLGQVFHNMNVKADGTKRTLADLRWFATDNSHNVLPEATEFDQAWNVNLVYQSYINQSLSDSNLWSNFFRFMPSYNGLHDNFDNDKALIYGKGNQTIGARMNDWIDSEGGITYHGANQTDDNPNGWALANLNKEYNEWQIRDLRANRQRLAVRVTKLIETICRVENSGYNIKFDPDFFTAGNPYWQYSFMALNLITPTDMLTKDKIFTQQLSGFDYLISFMKTFGLMLVAGEDGSYTLMMRNNFYINKTIDLNGKVDANSQQMKPLTFDALFYKMTSKEAGNQISKEYQKEYAIPYGQKLINTNYEFNQSEKELLDKYNFDNGVTILDSSKYYYQYYERVVTFESNFYAVSPVAIDNFGYDLYESNTAPFTNSFEKEYKYGVQGGTSSTPFNASNPSSDFFPKLCLFDNDSSADIANTLVFWNARKDIPTFPSDGVNISMYAITKATALMLELNDGNDCYYMANQDYNENNVPYIKFINYLPQFTRIHSDSFNISSPTNTFDFGKPLKAYYPTTDYTDNTTLFNQFMARMYEDQFDINTRLVTVNVRLDGLKIGQELLRQFYVFSDSLWIMNKLEKDVNSTGMAKCTFIRVKDKNNYLNGQFINK